MPAHPMARRMKYVSKSTDRTAHGARRHHRCASFFRRARRCCVQIEWWERNVDFPRPRRSTHIRHGARHGGGFDAFNHGENKVPMSPLCPRGCPPNTATATAGWHGNPAVPLRAQCEPSPGGGLAGKLVLGPESATAWECTVQLGAEVLNRWSLEKPASRTAGNSLGP